MKLADLIKKEELRTKTEIKAPVHQPTNQKVFKKERPWLEETPLKEPIETKKEEIISKISHDRPEIIIGKSQDNHEINKPISRASYDYPEINPETIIGKSQDNHEIKFDWFNFSKLQKNILIYIYKNCRFNASLTTTPIRSNEISDELKTTINSVRKTIYNLIKIKALSKHSFKDGPSGWSRLNINKDIYELLTIEEVKNRNPEIIIGKSQDNHEIRPEKIDSNSSSNSLIKKEELHIQFKIPENLKTIISQKEIANLINNQTITEFDLILSLQHFAHDYEKGLVKSKGSPVNLFFGLVRSGRKYNSLNLMEIENEDLKIYNSQFAKLEQENKKLKEESLKQKYRDFILKNPDFLKSVKDGSGFEISESVLENLAFSKFLEIQNET